MIERVKHITKDPLSAIHEEEERVLIDHIKNVQRGDKNYDPYEMDEMEDLCDDDLGNNAKEKHAITGS